MNTLPSAAPTTAGHTLARYHAIIATAASLGFPPAFAQTVWASMHGLTPEGRDRCLSSWEACALTWTPLTPEQAAEMDAADLTFGDDTDDVDCDGCSNPIASSTHADNGGLCEACAENASVGAER